MPLVSSDPDFNHSNPAVQSAGSLTGTGGQNQAAQNQSGGIGNGGRAEANGPATSGGGSPSAANVAHEVANAVGAGLSSGGIMNSSWPGGGSSLAGNLNQVGGSEPWGDKPTGPRGIVDPMGNQHPISSLDTLGIRDTSFVDPKMNAWKDYIGQGKTPNQAAGIAGSIYGESAFNPLATDYQSGRHKGIAQWGGDRLTNLQEFSGTPFGPSPAVGKPAAFGPAMPAQNDFIREEMMGTRYPDAGAQKLQKAMEANPDMSVEEAARAFTSMFERPSKKEYAKSIGGRIETAENIRESGTPGVAGSSSSAAFADPMSGPVNRAPIEQPVQWDDPNYEYKSDLTQGQYMGQFPTHNMMSILGGKLTPERYPDGFSNPLATQDKAQAFSSPSQGGASLSVLGDDPRPSSPAREKMMADALRDLGDRGGVGRKPKPAEPPKPAASTITPAPGPTTLETNMGLVYGAAGTPQDWYEMQRQKLERELRELGVNV